MGFFFSSSPSTRSAVFPRTRAARPGRGGCVDSLSLLMEKAHNVSSVHRLTLEASQGRTKLSQSSCPPWVSGLSSGFIKLLRKGTHQGRLSRKAVGPWPSAHQQLQLRKSALFSVCVSVSICVRTTEQVWEGVWTKRHRPGHQEETLGGNFTPWSEARGSRV